MTESILYLVFLLLGLLTGGLLSRLITKNKLMSQAVFSKELEEKYVFRKIYDNLLEQNELLREDLKEIEEDRLQLEKTLAVKERDLLYLEDKLATWQKDFEELQKRAQLEFENVANRLLEEKSQKFSAKNEEKLNVLLNPLKEKIKEFSLDIERRFTEEAKDKVSLKKEIEQLKDLNQQLSADAKNLATALKGDTKTQGNWGELQLEILLEKSGLQRGTHFEAQPSYKDENDRDKRPDFIIHLPGGKHLVIDSKVSLTAYEKFFNAEEEDLRKKYMREHIASIKKHIAELNGKGYQRLRQLTTPDYLLMFIPIEPAFSSALQEDSGIFSEALEKNIVIVTGSTLLATMRTVAYIWQQDRQKRNVLEIAKQSGLLFDKFVSFVDDLKEVGKRLDNAQDAWQGAMNKLSEAKRPGDSLIGKARHIQQLGARASKTLPEEYSENEIAENLLSDNGTFPTD